MTTWHVPAVITRWIDGDTFVADLDLGWHTWRHGARVRLLNYDAAELREIGGIDAKAMCELLAPVGVTVIVHSQKLDSFGRVLADVTLADGRDLVASLPP